jgi:hypothetical protein
MDALSAIVEIFRDLLIFVAVMFALLIALAVINANTPNDNPMKRMHHSLSFRVGATAAAGLLAIPIEPIPGLDALYDIAASLALLYSWFTFLRQARRTRRDTGAPPRLGAK